MRHQRANKGIKMTNNISKEAIAETLKLQDEYLLARANNLPVKTTLNLSGDCQFKLMQQVRELAAELEKRDALVDELAAELKIACNGFRLLRLPRSPLYNPPFVTLDDAISMPGRTTIVRQQETIERNINKLNQRITEIKEARSE